MPDVETSTDDTSRHCRSGGLVAAVAALAAGVPVSAVGDTPALVTASVSAAAFSMPDTTDSGRSPARTPVQDWDGLVSLAMGYLETAGNDDRAAPREPDPVPTN